MASKEMMDTIKSPQQTHFVFVHGISSGGWCWFKIHSRLESAGYKVTSPDLKSAGIDPTDPNSILTPDQYAEPLARIISAAPETERLILVGTSGGGLTLTNMIHRFPKKLDMVIFIGATMLRNGFMTEEDHKIGLPDLNHFNLGFELGEDQLPTNATMKKDATVELSTPLASPQDKLLNLLLQKPGPMQAMQGAKFIGEEGIDEVKRVFIKTTKDLTLTAAQQDAMIKKWPPIAVLDLESDHCPYFSAPVELYNLIIKAAAL